MIHHFPNLVCWEEVYGNFNRNRDILYVDSISCHLLGLVLATKGKYYSGPEMAYSLSEKADDKYYFLLPEEIKRISNKKCLVLEFKDSFVDDEEVLSFIRDIPSGSYIILGISSPKQNNLAIYLHSLRPDLDYFCLGAAVKLTWGSNYSNTRLRGTGLQWLEFLLFQPIRTFEKLATQSKEVLNIFSSVKSLRKFRSFISATGLDRTS